MPYNRPTLSEIVDRVTNDLSTRIIGSAEPLRRSVIRAFSAVIGGCVHLLYGFIAYMSLQMFPDTAVEEFLRRLADIWGISLNAATFGQFEIEIEGTDGSFVDQGTVFQRDDGFQYTTDTSGSISSGSLVVTVTCLTPGDDGNLAVDDTLQLLTPITGVTTEATVTDIILEADDEEDPEDMRVRLINRIQEPPHGGNENDYVQWAKEVTGVTRAWCYPQQFGAGTVGLAFMRDGDVDPIPSAGEVTDVQDYIDELRPVTATLTVYAPIASPLALTIELTPDTTEVREAVEAELEDLLLREAEPGGILLLSHIREAISSAAGETDNILLLPSGDVNEDAGDITTLGVITWQ